MGESIVKNFVKEVRADMLYSYAEYIMRGKNNKYFYINGKDIMNLNSFVQAINKNTKLYDEQTLDNFSKSMYYAFADLKSNIQVVVIVNDFNKLIDNLNISKEEFEQTLLIILKMYERDNESSNFIKKSLDFYLCPDNLDFDHLDKHLSKLQKTKKTLTRSK